MGKKVKTYSKPITIRLEERLRVLLDSTCLVSGQSISAYIRALLETHLTDEIETNTIKKGS